MTFCGNNPDENENVYYDHKLDQKFMKVYGKKSIKYFKKVAFYNSYMHMIGWRMDDNDFNINLKLE